MVDMTAFMSFARHNNQEFMLDLTEGNLLKNCLQQILSKENLASQRGTIETIAAELSINSLDCASALLYLLQSGKNTALIEQEINTPVLVTSQPNIKMVRYRLDVGSKHQLDLDILKQVLVEESGVDKNNIGNVKIQDLYTLIDLPDEMPLDIFQHLKSVEINQQKLDIRRVKSRNKKRGNGHHRRGRQAGNKSGNKISNQISS
jgi:hypothetical protein